jgi:NAD(P)-dependent dehydrogenase (short-subunit alcohol dehydrogenase family)
MGRAFDGKIVLVTGANSGIGEAIALAFLEGGATVFGLVRRNEALEESRRRHPMIRWVLADVANAKEVKPAIEAVIKEAGRLDVLVNNAGIYHFSSLEETSEELVRRQFEINVFGTTFATQAALPALKKSRGCVINNASILGHKPSTDAGIYAATKAAIESLTRSWAIELAPFGVRVNAVAPGPIDTPGFEKSGIPASGLAKVKEDLKRKVPLGRLGTSQEVARWAVALAGSDASWITGQIFGIDGGSGIGV